MARDYHTYVADHSYRFAAHDYHNYQANDASYTECAHDYHSPKATVTSV